MSHFDYETYFFGFYNGVAWGVIAGIVITTIAVFWAAKREKKDNK